MARLLDHIFAVLLRCVDLGYKIELIQIFHQLTNFIGVLRFCQLNHGVQLFSVCPLQRLNGLAHSVQLRNFAAPQKLQMQGFRHLFRQVMVIQKHMCIGQAVNAGAVHHPLNLLHGGREIEVWRMERKVSIGHDLQRQKAAPVRKRGKLLTAVMLLQHHPIIVDHAIGGNRPLTAFDQSKGCLPAIPQLVLL